MAKHIKLIIAGGRDFTAPGDNDLNWHTMCQALRTFRDEHGDPHYIVCGMARGADLLGKQWAEYADIPVREFPAKWRDEHGRLDKAAGHKRNDVMAKVGTHLIAFWDGESKGTHDMIKRARKRGLHVTVIYYNQPKDVKTLW